MQTSSPVLFPPLLLATDGSPGARFAQMFLYPIAELLQVQAGAGTLPIVILLTVQPQRSSRSRKFGRAAVSAVIPEALKRSGAGNAAVAQVSAGNEAAEALLATIAAEFPAMVTVDRQVRQGRPATEILNYAHTAQVGLVAVGQHGSGGVRELLLGSVSSVIARYAACNVLVARGTSAAASGLQRVLLVVDGTVATRQAIALTRQLVPAGIEQITLLCPQTPLNTNYPFGPFVTPTPSSQLSRSLQAAQKERSEHLLQQAKQALNLPQLDVQMLAQTSEPGPLICQVAQQRQSNLIIIGSDATRRSLLTPLQNLRKSNKSKSSAIGLENRRPLRNTRLSATEDYTIHHAPCPVLLCRVDRQQETR